MDIYPTAHYMWPDNPTYLTDQHNVVLTVFYGAVASVSRYFTDSNDAVSYTHLDVYKRQALLWPLIPKRKR